MNYFINRDDIKKPTWDSLEFEWLAWFFLVFRLVPAINSSNIADVSVMVDRVEVDAAITQIAMKNQTNNSPYRIQIMFKLY